MLKNRTFCILFFKKCYYTSMTIFEQFYQKTGVSGKSLLKAIIYSKTFIFFFLALQNACFTIELSYRDWYFFLKFYSKYRSIYLRVCSYTQNIFCNTNRCLFIQIKYRHTPLVHKPLRCFQPMKNPIRFEA